MVEYMADKEPPRPAAKKPRQKKSFQYDLLPVGESSRSRLVSSSPYPSITRQKAKSQTFASLLQERRKLGLS